MSWQLASFAIVFACLGGAFVWYERSHPPAKLLAVVATLAALAALGRDAFAAVPDVKPITTIVLVGGIAFGAGPGFAIGAISGLASNVLLGQGPWTPWQMLGWGLVGLFGAALGALGGRRMGPFALALSCAVAAELFNLVVDLYTWTGTGNHTLAAFGLVLAAALAFDLTHVIASFAFAFVFGGVLLRMLVRVRGRLQVRWVSGQQASWVSGQQASWASEQQASGASEPESPVAGEAPRAPRLSPALLAAGATGVLVLGVLAATLPGTGAGPPLHARRASARATLAHEELAHAALAHGEPAHAASAHGEPAHAGAFAHVEPTHTAPAHGVLASASPTAPLVVYLRHAQEANGGFGADPGEGSSELYTAWAAIGLAAAGQNPQGVRRDGHTPLDAIRAEAGTLEGAGDLERTILALRACGASVRSLPGGDPVARLLALRGREGSFGHLVNLTSFAIFALRAAGYPRDAHAVRTAAAWLASQQNADGGFGFAKRGGTSDVDDTGAALQALVAAGAGSERARSRALAYLHTAQNPDGGFPQERGGASNAQSTAWAVQGLIAAGGDPASMHRGGGRDPLAYLRGLVQANGSVRYAATGSQTPVWVTAQALAALAGKPLPVAPVRAPGG